MHSALQARALQIAQRKSQLEEMGRRADQAEALATVEVDRAEEEARLREQEERPWLYKGQGLLEDLSVTTLCTIVGS